MGTKKYPGSNPNEGYLIDCPGCGKRLPHKAKGHCFNCYRKLIWKPKKITCKNCGKLKRNHAFGLCDLCYHRIHNYDTILKYNIKKLHNIELYVYKEITKECLSCGFNKVVELHHLDRNKKNNAKRNLIGLCPNCHKMIHSYTFLKEIKENLRRKGIDVSKISSSNYFKGKR
ncbi:MAG: hypothetical protein ISS23_03635 [Nanoarchaeota archaeon]|nr:hypothetical protein [Nanoarchaeota archaeon]